MTGGYSERSEVRLRPAQRDAQPTAPAWGPDLLEAVKTTRALTLRGYKGGFHDPKGLTIPLSKCTWIPLRKTPNTTPTPSPSLLACWSPIPSSIKPWLSLLLTLGPSVLKLGRYRTCRSAVSNAYLQQDTLHAVLIPERTALSC